MLLQYSVSTSPALHQSIGTDENICHICIRFDRGEDAIMLMNTDLRVAAASSTSWGRHAKTLPQGGDLQASFQLRKLQSWFPSEFKLFQSFSFSYRCSEPFCFLRSLHYLELFR
ncbi:hypothetical protein ANCCAN_02552, partial [Ancylostoma caninum]